MTFVRRMNVAQHITVKMLTIKLVASLLLEQRIANVTQQNFLHLEPLKFVPANLKIDIWLLSLSGGWEIELPGWGGEFELKQQSLSSKVQMPYP